MMMKRLKYLLISIFIMFAIYNVIWATYVFFLYYPYINELGGTKHWENDGYAYYVYPPSYLSFVNGNLYISERKELNDIPKEGCISLIIWPHIDGHCDISVFVQTPETYDSEINDIYVASYGLRLDENLMPDLSEEINASIYSEHEELFLQNWDDVENIIAAAEIRWHINI